MTERDDPLVGELQQIADFPVDVECEGFPDVIFEIIFQSKVTEALTEKAVRTLEEFVARYNRLHFLRPIHYVSGLEDLPQMGTIFSVCVHMDFGNASPRGLLGAVRALRDSRLPIYRLILQ